MPPCIDLKLFIWPGLPGVVVSSSAIDLTLSWSLRISQKTKDHGRNPENIQCPVLIGGNLGTSSKFIKFNAWVP